ncbi:MAG: glycosyltransferase [Clostridia bacterium]|nr:glycosyltransferase [Clostridia bacterium]
MEKPEKNIKILEFIDSFYPSVDGAINVVKFYCEELSKVSTCKLATSKASKKQKYKDQESFDVLRCKSVSAPQKYRYPFPAFDRKFVKKIREEKFDIMHTHSPFTLGRMALRIAKKQNIPVVATLHTQYHQDFKRYVKFNFITRLMCRYLAQVYKRADSVWTVSNKSCQTLRDYGYKGKIEVIRNGTDMVYPENAPELIQKINDMHALHDQKIVFLFVGRMAWYKNLKIILDALKMVKDGGKDFKMLFVGGGFDFEEVKAYAKDVDVADKCIFTGSVGDKQLLQGYYLRADALLFPSTFDMAPVTAVEAAAHNLPAVMTEGSCSAELVEDNVNGFLAKENAQSFADKLFSIIDKPDLLKEVGINAGKTLYRSWEMVAREVYQKYQEIIEEKKKKTQK